jgi:tetratricopeptide repeat protein/glycosyl transferase family 9 (putative heptosyltransferase)
VPIPSDPNPTTASQWFSVATRLSDVGLLPDAIRAYQRTLELDPRHVPAWLSMGTAYAMQSSWKQAIEAYQHAASLAPSEPAAHYNLGAALSSAGDWDEALASYQRAAQLAPDNPMMLHHLGNAQFNTGSRDQGIAALRRAIALKPDNPFIHSSLATCLLATGQWEEGWRESQWRLVAMPFQADRTFTQPQWDGSPISGKTLFLHAEGGHGDAIQFVRYVPIAATSGATILLECQPALIDLFKQIPGVSKLIARSDPLPHFDFHIPLQGMPCICKTTEQTIPARSPYLKAPPDRIEKFASQIPSFSGLKVALVWAGRPFPDDIRTRDLSAFTPLASIPGVQFYSLQNGPESKQTPPTGMNWIDLSPQIADFADAAGLLAHLDLLITVDTAAAHLAGAMGKPVWTLIPRWSDFRWLLDREDSPWYPTMRLFRQTKWLDWRQPMNRIAQELTNLAQSRGSI